MKLNVARAVIKAVILSALVLMTASGIAGLQALAASPGLSQSNNAGNGLTIQLGLDNPSPTPTPAPPLPVP
ncbi:MAG: hypothetical protein JO287_16680 [Pseudonocardiales bacterium]|nr:hypothetical protein [Pseudonocardiales bacterium]